MTPTQLLQRAVRTMTQHELARRLGVRQSTISRWLSGERNAEHMRATLAERLRRVLR